MVNHAKPCECTFFTRPHTYADHGLGPTDDELLEDVRRALLALDLLPFARWTGRMRRGGMSREAETVQRLRETAIRRVRDG